MSLTTRCACFRRPIVGILTQCVNRNVSKNLGNYFLTQRSDDIFQTFTRSKYTEVDYVKSSHDRFVFPEPPEMVSEEEHNNVLEQVNECIASPECGRLFAVIQISGLQFKVTDHDLIRTAGFLAADVGEKIRLEKVLLVGGRDFSLVGRPLIRRDLVEVEATVVENTPAVVKVHQKFKRKCNSQKRKFITPLHTVLRINSIRLNANIMK